MKVLFTIDGLINAGTERSMLDLVPHFSDATQLTMVYFYPWHALKAEYEEAGIPLIYVDLPGKLSFWQGIKRLMKIIRQEKPEIVVSSLLRANIITRIACKLTGTKLIGTFVSDSYSEQRSASFSLKRKVGAYIFYLLDKFTSGIPVAWISNSGSIKKSNCAALSISEKKVKVIYRGRNAAQFKAWQKPADDSTFVFATIGRLYETKGFSDLVIAFNEVSKKHPNIRLEIYGDGPYRNQLTKQIAQLQLENKITLHGNIKNAWQKLYSAACFVFPSWYEGFSGALVEAMMTGIPIIASDIPMNLEAVENNTTALVHLVKDSDSLQSKMQLMMEDYPHFISMGERARTKACKDFDIKNIAKQYELFLKEVAGR